MRVDTRHLLADLVRSEHPELCRPPYKGGGYVPDDDTPVVVADDVAAWLTAQESSGEASTVQSARRIDGPLAMAPPMYDEFWVEASYYHPDLTDGVAYRVGAMVSTAPADDVLEVSVCPWTQNRHGVHRFDVGTIYEVAHDGTVRFHEWKADPEYPSSLVYKLFLPFWAPPEWQELAASTVPQSVPRQLFDDGDQGPLVTLAVLTAELVVATCAFAICRNVTPETVQVPDKVARKRGKALGLPPRTSYSRLHLPGFERWTSAKRVAAGAGAQTLPAHLVRAHPKTYKRNADGSGGLGRYHAEGTWLWRPQVRGNPARGERIPVVEVSPPQQ